MLALKSRLGHALVPSIAGKPVIVAVAVTFLTCCCAVQVHRLGVGDAVGICTNDQGDLVVEANSGEVRQATVRPTYGATAVPHMPAPPPGKAESFSSGESILFPTSSDHCPWLVSVSHILRTFAGLHSLSCCQHHSTSLSTDGGCVVGHTAE